MEGLAGRAPSDAPAPAVDEEEARPPLALEGQLDLFDDLAALRRDLEAAIERGAFEEALALRERLDEEYGATAVAAYAFLDALGAELWRLAPREVLAASAEVECDLVAQPALGEHVRRSVLSRLIATHGAEALVADAPDALPAVVNALAEDDEKERGLARRLVRDALLERRSLEPLDFRDSALRDLLAEDMSPSWLACLGVVRRLWPVTPAGDAAPDADDGQDDDARARAFWCCLHVTEDHDAPEAALHDARRRMKRLNPALHALYLRRLV